jgi:pimeloyl-ACP methyl ester carboxylesterase
MIGGEWTDSVFRCPGGEVAVREWGDPAGPVVLCLPGLSTNVTIYRRVAERLPERHLVAIDARGRGLSQITPPNTYGWGAHINDAMSVADQLGADTFDLIGHSLGAFLSMAIATSHPERVERVVLIDSVALPDSSALPIIVNSLARIGTVYPSTEAYLEWTRANIPVDPWDPFWDEHYLRELEPVEGGVRVRTSLTAITMDATWAAGQDVESNWRRLHKPTMLLRAERPAVAGAGLLVPEDVAQRFETRAPDARVLSFDADHYTILSHAPALEAIAAFLAR